MGAGKIAQSRKSACNTNTGPEFNPQHPGEKRSLGTLGIPALMIGRKEDPGSQAPVRHLVSKDKKDHS